MSLVNITIKDIEGGIIVHLLTRIAEALERVAPIPHPIVGDEKDDELGISVASDERLIELEDEMDEKIRTAARGPWGSKLMRGLTAEEKARWAEIEDEQARENNRR